MKYVVHGSALVVLLIILSAGIVCSMGVWRYSLLMYDVVTKKERYYQHMYATHGLLWYGCTIAAHNGIALAATTRPCVVTFHAWPITDTRTGRGTITITAQGPEQLCVHASLHVDNHELHSVQCTVHAAHTSESDYDIWSQAYIFDCSSDAVSSIANRVAV